MRKWNFKMHYFLLQKGVFKGDGDDTLENSEADQR